MNLVDIVIIIGIAGLILAGFSVKKIRKKKGKGCCNGSCGNCSGCN